MRSAVSILFITFLCGETLGQGRIFAEITDAPKILVMPNLADQLGNDFYLAIPTNFGASVDAQKEFDVFITSTNSTVVNIQRIGQPIEKRPVKAGKTVVYRISPASAGEINTAGVVEKTKAIHIWPDAGQLSVYFMSRNLYTSDGMYVIPTEGWGTEYVVAAFASLQVFEQNKEYPSEFVIVAKYDSTICTITPSQDFRLNGSPDSTAHKKGVPFDIILNAGECIQYQVTRAQDDSWDVTGTVITSNKPIGVVGASQCPFIPTSDPYCDHIVEMIPPIKNWGTTYYTVPFAGRRVGGDTFLAIASDDNQTIYRNGSVYSVLNKQKHLFDNSITDQSVWTSDKPFMLVQYINSSTFGTNSGPRNEGDPAMVMMNPAASYSKNTLIQTPPLIGSGQPKFFHFINILLPTSSFLKTTMDGFPLTAIPGTTIERFPITGSGWEGVRIKYITRGTGEGAHIIRSDTAVGAYAYGISTDDSYAWAGPSKLDTTIVMKEDSIRPVITFTSECYCAKIMLTDSTAGDLGLAQLVVDTNSNFTLIPSSITDSINDWDSISFSICVSNPKKAALLRLSVSDHSSNTRKIVCRYKTYDLAFSAANTIIDYDTTSVTPIAMYLYLFNLGETDIYIDPSLFSLQFGDRMFTIDSIGKSDTLRIGEVRTIKVHHGPDQSHPKAGE